MTMTIWQSPAIALLTAGAVVCSTAAYAQKKDPAEQAVLLGQFGDWGAYKATPGGKKVCFALAKPARQRPIRPAATATRPTPSSPPALLRR
jgi:hypothetical protein